MRLKTRLLIIFGVVVIAIVSTVGLVTYNMRLKKPGAKMKLDSFRTQQQNYSRHLRKYSHQPILWALVREN